jgi:hypothetical protein
MQHPGNLGYVIVRQDLGSVGIQNSRGSEEFELFVTIELQGGADAVQNFAADTPVARFQAAEGAVTDVSPVGDLLLAEPALLSEADQHVA